MRAPYNVLVIPYISKSENPLFCIFKRADMGVNVTYLAVK